MGNARQKYLSTASDRLFTDEPSGPVMPHTDRWQKKDYGSRAWRAQVNLVGADQIEDVGPEYLLPGTLLQDCHQIIVGLPNLGKSTLMAAMAATISNSECDHWMGKAGVKHGTVVIFNSEDSNGVLKRRLEAAGADLRNIMIIGNYRELQGKPEESFSTKDHGDILKLELKSIKNVVAIFFDNIEGLLGGFGQTNSGVRKAFDYIKSIVPVGCAIIGVTHFRKDFNGKNPLGSISGSSAVGQVARSILAARKVEGKTAPDGSQLFALVREKVIDGGGVGGGNYYSIEGVCLSGCRDTSRIVWHEEFFKLEEPESNKNREKGSGKQKTLAIKFLVGQLAHGPAQVKNLQKLASEQDISARTLERAREELQIPAIKSAIDGSWWVGLPGTTRQQFEIAATGGGTDPGINSPFGETPA